MPGTAEGIAKAREARAAAREAEASALDDCRPLIAGIDTLNLTTRAELRPELVTELKALREEAVRIRKGRKKGAQAADLPRWRANALGVDFEVQPYGTRKGVCLLVSEQAALVLNPDGPKNFPRAYVELKSPLLWGARWDNAARIGTNLLAEAAGLGPPDPGSEAERALDAQVSRVDLACDFMGWQPQPELLDHVIGKVVRRDLNFEWGQHEQKEKREAEGKLAPYARTHTQGRRFTGFTFGGGNLLARLYDKTVEIRRSGKQWFEPLWQRAGWVNAEESGHIWRLEFQIRREPLTHCEVSSELDAHEVKSWSDVKRALDPLWRYLTRKWLTYRLPRTKHSRVNIHPRWLALMATTFVDDPQRPNGAELYRHRERIQLERCLGALGGYLVREYPLHLKQRNRLPNEQRFEEDLLEVLKSAVDHYESRHDSTAFEAGRQRWRQNRKWEALFGGPRPEARA